MAECSGWSSDGEEVDACGGKAPPGSARAQGRAAAERSRSPARCVSSRPSASDGASGAVDVAASFTHDVSEVRDIACWQKHVIDSFSEYREQKWHEGETTLRRAMAHHSLCTGLGTEVLACKATRVQSNILATYMIGPRQ